YAARLSRSRLPQGANRVVNLGYAVPGSVIAVGVLIPVTRVDKLIAQGWTEWFGVNPGLILTGGIAALVYAYLARFLSMALQTVDASLGKITPNMDDASRILGYGRFATLWRVHVPIPRDTLLAAGFVGFVERLKEVPA